MEIKLYRVRIRVKIVIFDISAKRGILFFEKGILGQDIEDEVLHPFKQNIKSDLAGISYTIFL